MTTTEHKANKRRSTLRVFFGFLAAPVLPCAFLAMPDMALNPEWTLMAYALAVCYSLILLLAFPIYVHLKATNRVNLASALVTGSSIGAVVGILPIVSIALSAVDYTLDYAGGTIVAGSGGTIVGTIVVFTVLVVETAAVGAVTGFIFWVIAVWRNPSQA